MSTVFNLFANWNVICLLEVDCVRIYISLWMTSWRVFDSDRRSWHCTSFSLAYAVFKHDCLTHCQFPEWYLWRLAIDCRSQAEDGRRNRVPAARYSRDEAISGRLGNIPSGKPPFGCLITLKNIDTVNDPLLQLCITHLKLTPSIALEMIEIS